MTIKDLAAQTGYAVGTVSRALNGHPNVSPKARQAILEAAETSGFQLNLNAKQLKQQRFNTVLAVVKGTRNELFSDLVEAIQEQISRTVYQLVVDYRDEDENEALRALRMVREKKPAGILFLGGNNRNLAQALNGLDIPAVLVTGDAAGLGLEQLSSVSIDDRAAARCAVEALIGMGHRNIAIIGGDREVSDISRLRFQGCMDAFAAHGIDFDPQKHYQGVRFSYLDGYRAAQELLASKAPFSAIFAIADVMAIGAIRALGEQGLRVPEDVSVMGLDGLALGDFTVPQLATVRQNVEQLAQRSVEILLDAMEQGTGSCHETVPFSLLSRESVCDKEGA